MDQKMIKGVLTNYLEKNNMRKTPERFAIIDAVCKIQGHFTLNQLNEKLEEDNFRVSRATLYNTLKLFIKMQLVIRHHLLGETKYEACHPNAKHCHQICTICNRIVELEDKNIIRAIENAHLKRFRKDGFSLYIYGVCSSCLSKKNRR